MSDNIPLEIQSEIMKRLPVKSLIRFRSVSKPWKAFINSSEFIANHHRQHHYLLVSYLDPDNDFHYFSIFDDDDTFPKQKFSHTVPDSIDKLNRITMHSSQGLLCFFGTYAEWTDRDHYGTTDTAAVFWNPSIRKSVVVDVPVVLGYSKTVLGFGVCPDTCDAKLVKVALSSACDTIVEVFSLRAKVWRRLSTSFPRKSIVFIDEHVSVDRCIYWKAWDRSDGCDLIMSFDIIIEEFSELHLPDSFASLPECYFDIFKARESLVVVQWITGDEKRVFSVWMMEHGDPKTFTKQYTINTHNGINRILGFRCGGEPIIKMAESDMEEDDIGRIECDDLFVYEPYSKRIKPIGIFDMRFRCNVSSYMETLLLLNNISYFDIFRRQR